MSEKLCFKDNLNLLVLEINRFIQAFFFVCSNIEGDKFPKNNPLIIPILHVLSLALGVLIISASFVMLFLHFS